MMIMFLHRFNVIQSGKIWRLVLIGKWQVMLVVSVVWCRSDEVNVSDGFNKT